MGIQNRDYYRSDSTSGRWSLPSGRSMCQNILISTAVVFLFQLWLTVPDRALGGHASLLELWGALEPFKVLGGQIWRLVTYAFLHDRGSAMHIVFNMFVLWTFGPVIEERLGRREFLAFYLMAAVAAGLCHVLLALGLRDPTGAVGASGALMGIVMLFALYFPRTQISLFLILNIEARWLILLYVVLDGFPILKALSDPNYRSDGIAHAAHLGGLLFGYIYFASRMRLTGWTAPAGGPSLGRRLTKWWTRPALKVYQSPVEPEPRVYHSPEDLERQVDAILKKIKDQGEASLTAEERKLLRDASRAYKKRNT